MRKAHKQNYYYYFYIFDERTRDEKKNMNELQIEEMRVSIEFVIIYRTGLVCHVHDYNKLRTFTRIFLVQFFFSALTNPSSPEH